MKAILFLCFFALFSVIMMELVSPFSPRFKGILSWGAGLVFFFFLLQWLKPAVDLFSVLTEKTEKKELFTVLFKAIGISFLVSVCASFCRDLGEDSIAKKLELCGKGAVLSLSLPILEGILEWIDRVMT